MRTRFQLLPLGFIALFGLFTTLNAAEVKPKIEGDVAWYDATQWEPEGRGWSENLRYFDRLPAKAEKNVRKRVWNLSRDSAGMLVRFATDAPRIDVRYKLHKGSIAMPHMPATGVSGVDLYVKHEGQWRWLGIVRPTAQDVKGNLVNGMTKALREYMLYLPLYNGVDTLEIGVPKGASFEAIDPRKEKTIVFYGTSIMQGGCVSRPGMSQTAILGRSLDCPTINLGFSGNGTMDPSISDLMAELDAAVYVIDCLPNLGPDNVAKRTEPLVNTLRKARPNVPIVLVEDRTYGDSFLVQHRQARNNGNRVELKKAYERLIAAGVKNLYYVEGDQLLGSDGEATVDGSHPTDLGMLRQASVLEPILRELLKK